MTTVGGRYAGKTFTQMSALTFALTVTPPRLAELCFRSFRLADVSFDIRTDCNAAKAGGVMFSFVPPVIHSLIHSVCEQDNSRWR